MACCGRPAERWGRAAARVPVGGDHAHADPDDGAIARTRDPRDWLVSVWPVPTLSARRRLASGHGARRIPRRVVSPPAHGMGDVTGGPAAGRPPW